MRAYASAVAIALEALLVAQEAKAVLENSACSVRSGSSTSRTQHTARSARWAIGGQGSSWNDVVQHGATTITSSSKSVPDFLLDVLVDHHRGNVRRSPPVGKPTGPPLHGLAALAGLVDQDVSSGIVAGAMALWKPAGRVGWPTEQPARGGGREVHAAVAGVLPKRCARTPHAARSCPEVQRPRTSSMLYSSSSPARPSSS